MIGKKSQLVNSRIAQLMLAICRIGQMTLGQLT